MPQCVLQEEQGHVLHVEPDSGSPQLPSSNRCRSRCRASLLQDCLLPADDASKSEASGSAEETASADASSGGAAWAGASPSPAGNLL